MDMGIKGRKAIVCAASKGLGKGCAMALAGEGVDLVINARTQSELEATAEEIRKKYGVKVTPVAVDVTTEAGRKQVLAAGRRATSATGIARTGSRRSTPTC
jgi:3-oxoacyl-[acyl-carrier protein] reductase